MRHSTKYLVLALFISVKAISQEVPKGFELMEIVKIAETYRLTPDISFDMSFTYTDSATPAVIIERMNGKYKIHNGKYWGMLDSIEFLQGGLYNLAVYHKDSIIIINNREEYAAVMQVPLMDSLFREANVKDMEVKKINDSTRSLSVKFHPHAQYNSYELQYDLNSFLIRKVIYYLKQSESSDETTGSGIVCVTIYFSNYSEELINDQQFNETRFVYRQGEQLLPQPLFTGFRIVYTGSEQGR